MSTALQQEVFRALSDPTRRAMLRMLGDGERAAGELGTPFDITPSAVSQHLAVLRQAGLVEERREGRSRVYTLRPGPLREAVDWFSWFEQFWGDRLTALDRYLDTRKKENRR
jgi:DNA-binding transcriptional ArsR family regulator